MRKAIAILFTMCLLLMVSATVPVFTISLEGPKAPRPVGTRAIIIVGPDQTITTISAGVTAASAGDTIRVYNGTYDETVTINKPLTIIGNGTENTKVLPSSFGNVFTIASSWVNISAVSCSIGSTTIGYAAISVNQGNSNIRIENCNMTKNYYGFRFSGSSTTTIKNILISNCTINENNYGGYQYYSHYCNISNNSISYNLRYGIYSYQSDYNSYENNTVNSSAYPYDPLGETALYLYYAENDIIKNNTFESCGIHVRGGSASDYDTHYLQDNTVNGRDLVYMESVSDLTIPADAGQVFLVNCDKMKIENQNLSAASVGVILAYSTEVIISNITCDYNYIGLFLFQSNYFYGYNCSCEFNREAGVYPYQSNYGELHNSTIKNCSNYGVYSFISSYGTYENNTLQSCGYPYYDLGHFGIALQSSRDMVFNNNNFTKCGIAIYSSASLTYWNTHSFFNNSANGKEIVYIKDSDGATISPGFGEVIIANSDNVIISDQNLSYSSVGVNVGYSDNLIVRNCTISDNYYGIGTEVSHYPLYQNNTFNDSRYGINSMGTSSSPCLYPVCENSTFNRCYNGFYMNNNDNATVMNNTFVKCDYGVYFYYTNYAVVRNNTFNDSIDSCVRIYAHSESNIVENNFMNGSDNYGIYMTYHVNYNILRNNSIWNCDDGLYLNGQSNVYTMYLTVENNTCWDNNYNINCRYTENLTITKNYLHNGSYGIYTYRANFFKIHNNTINDNNYGIYVSGSSSAIQYNHSITNNTFLVNNYAIRLYYAYKCNIENNTCIEGNNYGIYIQSANINRIINNSFFGFNTYGAYINSGLGNRLYYNAFYDNGGTNSQARDLTTTNRWHGSVHGNWWHNWTSPDANSDGIVDRPYNIDSTTSQDLYPLTLYMADIQAPGNLTPYQDLFYSDNFTQKNGSTPLVWTLSSNASWLTLGPGPKISGTAGNDDVGPYWVEASILNSKMQESSLNVTINVMDVNDPPTITTLPNVNATEDLPYWTNFSVADIDLPGDTFTWSLKSNESFLSIDTMGNLSGTPANADVGLYWVNVTVSDGRGGEDSVNFTLNVSNVNDDPQIITSDVVVAYQDELYEVDYNATDIDPTNDTLNWSLSTNSTWLTMNSTTGILNGTPAQADVGDYWVNVSVEDGAGGEDYSLFNLTVLESNYPPVITTVDQTQTDEDVIYSVQYLATDMNLPNDFLTWSLDSNATWLGLSLTGLLSGFPDNADVGIYYVNVTVDDTRGGSDYRYFELTVNNVNDRPIIINADVKTATEDVEYSVDYEANDIDPTNDVLTWSLKTNAGFLGIDTATGLLKGTPVNADVGEHWVNVTVTDSMDIAFRNFTLTVLNANDPPGLAVPVPEISFPEDTVYTGLNLSQLFKDIDLDPLTFSYSGGSHISVVIAPNTTVELTPAPDWSGTEVIAFFANDSLLQAGAFINITVTPVNDPPTDPLITTLETEYIEGEDQFIMGNCSDVDIDYGDVLTYTWYSNNSGLIGTGQTINLSLDAGHHEITLNVTDTGGLFVTAQMDLEVEAVDEPPVEPQNKAPTITLQEPHEDGQVIKGVFSVEWTAADPDEDIITITIEYSADETTWTTIADAMDNTGTLAWNTSGIGDGVYYLKLTASDGALTASTAPLRIVINNTVIIDEPDDDIVPPEDSDGDGLPDEWENDFFGNLDETAEGDFDNDNYTNLEEHIAGTDPTNPTDHPGGPVVDDDDDDTKEPMGVLPIVLGIIIALIVLIIIVIVVAVLLRRRKQAQEPSSAEQEEILPMPTQEEMDADYDLAFQAFAAEAPAEPPSEELEGPVTEEAPEMGDSLPIEEIPVEEEPQMETEMPPVEMEPEPQPGPDEGDEVTAGALNKELEEIFGI